MRWLSLVGIVLWAGCWNQERVKLLPSKAVVPLGAKMDLAVADGCTQDTFKVKALPGGKAPGMDIEWPTCSKANIRKDYSVSWGDDSIFGVEKDQYLHGRVLLTIKALKEGKTNLEVTVDTDATDDLVVEGAFQVKEAKEVKLEPVCPAEPGSWLLPPSREIAVKFSLIDDQGRTLTGYDYYPFKVGDMERVSGTGLSVTYKTPATLGTFEATSSVDPTLKESGAIVDVSSFDEMKLAAADEKPYVGESTEVRVQPLLKGQAPCYDEAEREFTVETPSICSLSSTGSVTTQKVTAEEGAVTVTGTSVGTCRVSGRLSGSAVSGTLELTFAEMPGILDPTRWKEHDLSAIPSLVLRGIWGAGPTSVYLVGSKKVQDKELPVLLHFDGNEWKEETFAAGKATVLNTIWGTSDSDIHVSGLELVDTGKGTLDTALMFHFDGSEWKEVATPESFNTVNSIWGSSATDVYAVGYRRYQTKGGGVFLHYDGTQWSEIKTPVDDVVVTAVWHVFGTGPKDVYIVGRQFAKKPVSGHFLLHGSGDTWSDEMSGTRGELGVIWGFGPSDLYLSEENLGQKMLHFDGSSWEPMPSFVASDTPRYLWGSSPDNLLAAGGRSLNHYDGNKWRAIDLGHAYTRGLWGSGAADVWLITNTKVYQFQ